MPAALVTIPVRFRNPSTAGPNTALRHAGTIRISRAPRSASSGSVQAILSATLPHDGKNPFRSTGSVNCAKQIIEATI
jgi:hypothetical protein